jgi:hypothetical protein
MPRASSSTRLCPGSGYILEYLDGLQGIKVDYKALEKAERAAKEGSASVTTSMATAGRT